MTKVPIEVRADLAVLAKRAYSIWTVGDYNEREEAMWMIRAQYVSWNAWAEIEGADIRFVPYYRADGRLICWDCWRPYHSPTHHDCPYCPELTVLCNGWRVKL